MKPASVADILAAYERLGDRLYGEAVSQSEHALQAAEWAARDGASEALIVAALLHDFGHLAEAEGQDAVDARHEAVGAALLKGLFGPPVIEPIALHVAAKRYLCAVEPGYLGGLSDASHLSLQLQGGPYSAEAAARFIARPHAADAVRLRRYDDQAKVVGAATPDFAAYAPMMSRLAVSPTGFGLARSRRSR
jgi:phosphonate degradation associated HDIG domain protein